MNETPARNSPTPSRIWRPCSTSPRSVDRRCGATSLTSPSPASTFVAMARGEMAARAVRWVVLAGYVLVASGVPLPIAPAPAGPGSPAARRLAGKDRSRPFPCMDKPCGCATAEQCFSSCCCNSPAELMAWAEANRVDPATLLVLRHRVASAAAEASAESCCCSAAPAEPSCCTATATPPTDCCREDRSLEVEPSCCEAVAAPRQQPAGDIAASVAPRSVSLRAMLACGGILAGWSAAMTSLPPPAALRHDEAMPLVAVIVVANDVSRSADLPTDSPPPRA